MTAWLTASTVFRLFKLYRQIPHPVWHAFANMLWFVACMRLMTRTACTPPAILINVQVMQIETAVAEIGQGGGFRLQDKRLLVTGKAKFVVLRGKRRVELRRVLLDKKSKMIAAVSLMTSVAILLGNGTVHEFLSFQLMSKGRQDFVFADTLRFAVTGHAKGRRIAL